jgi:fatty-acyl-CoA synthase
VSGTVEGTIHRYTYAEAEHRLVERVVPQLPQGRASRSSSRDGLIALLARQFPRWLLPGDVVIVPELSHTATGKLMKTRLREMFRDRKPTER